MATQLRRPLRLAGALLLIGLVYLGNTRTPPEFRFGILYVIPVLLAAWHDGLGWGIAFAFATALLRFVGGIDQMAPGTALVTQLVNDGTVANAAAARLASSIRTVFRGTPSVTASIGVVSWTGGNTDSDDVLRKADAAMYEAKRAGKDRVVQVAI